MCLHCRRCANLASLERKCNRNEKVTSKTSFDALFIHLVAERAHQHIRGKTYAVQQKHVRKVVRTQNTKQAKMYASPWHDLASIHKLVAPLKGQGKKGVEHTRCEMHARRTYSVDAEKIVHGRLRDVARALVMFYLRGGGGRGGGGGGGSPRHIAC